MPPTLTTTPSRPSGVGQDSVVFPTGSYIAWSLEVRRLGARCARRTAAVMLPAAALLLAALVACAWPVLGSPDADPAVRRALGDALALGALGTASVVVFALSFVMRAASRMAPLGQQKDWEGRLPMQIQTSILPRQLDIQGIEIAARMTPAEEVGGDYYDVIPSAGGCWIGIGDVAGHGLEAGMVMFMVQGIVQALVRIDPEAPPSAIVIAANRTVWENLTVRARRHHHVTFCLVHYWADGRLVFAGGHEDIVIRRSAGRCEAIPTEGTWLGLGSDITRATEDSEAQLGPGDLMLLYTDGITEARRTRNDFFGPDRLAELLERQQDLAAGKVRDEVMAAVDAWAPREDDRTLVAVRCQGVYWG